MVLLTRLYRQVEGTKRHNVGRLLTPTCCHFADRLLISTCCPFCSSLRNENEVAKEAEPAEEAGHDAEEKKELEPEDKEEKPIELVCTTFVFKYQ